MLLGTPGQRKRRSLDVGTWWVKRKCGEPNNSSRGFYGVELYG